MLDDPVRGAAIVKLFQVALHSLQRAPAGPDAADRRDLAAEGQDRLDLERRAHRRLRGSDATATAQVLEGVQAEPDVQPLASPLHRVDDRPGLGALLRLARGGDDETAQAAGARLGVDDLDAAGVTLTGENVRRLRRALPGPRQSACQVDRHDVAARADEWLEAGTEVPDRRLRRRRQRRRLAQARIEGI